MPVSEFVFARPRRWRFDLSWLDEKVACEVEGGTWIYGRHSRPQGIEKDAEKYNEAAINGWLVLRVTNTMVHDGRALAVIKRGLQARQ